jgi:uroporphyrinogen decarboxylase
MLAAMAILRDFGQPGDKLCGAPDSGFGWSIQSHRKRIHIKVLDKPTTNAATRSLPSALAGVPQSTPPLWLMRQAGRYLPEYREVRKHAKSFLDFCYTPERAIEVTLQPIRRFGFDASIIFSDILTIPDALQRNVRFLEGEGPHMDPLEDPAVIATLRAAYRPETLLPVYEAVRGVRAALPQETALLGFCGAPWTVATYMIAGKGTKEQAPARLFAYRHPVEFQALLDLLVEVSADHLVAQLDAGADTVQIFDSWASVLPAAEFDRWCIAPVKALVAKVRAARPKARIIAFPRGATTEGIQRFVRQTKVDGLSLDTATDLAGVAALKGLPTLQGNLDPLALVAGGHGLDRAVQRILEVADGRPYIFNLGHGILPETPIPHVERLIRLIRG